MNEDALRAGLDEARKANDPLLVLASMAKAYGDQDDAKARAVKAMAQAAAEFVAEIRAQHPDAQLGQAYCRAMLDILEAAMCIAGSVKPLYGDQAFAWVWKNFAVGVANIYMVDRAAKAPTH